MKNTLLLVTGILIAVAVVVSAGVAGNTAGEKRSGTAAKTTTDAKPTQSPDEQIAGLDAMCAANAGERAARHAETPLFERLGGEEGIHALTREVVRLHLQNDAIKYMFEDLNADKVAHRVALFMISGTGGPASYDGPELKVSHAKMGLTNADFLAAGADVIQAMKNLGYEQNEIDEVVCILVSLRDQVVLTEDGEKKASRY